MTYFAAGAALVGTLSASSGPAASGTAPQESKPFFFTGTFTAATGKASATGAPGVVPLVAAGVILLMLSKWKE